jgi:hypothetical protein
MAQVKLMTQAEYARHRGCSGVAVFKAIKAGRISLIDGRIDASVADIQWEANSRKSVAIKNPIDRIIPEENDPENQPTDGYHVSRARREAAEASISEIKEAELRGKYLEKSEVDSAVYEIARSLRDGLTNCSRRIAADVAGVTSAEECESIIDREHRALLESMSHHITAKLGKSTVESTL